MPYRRLPNTDEARIRALKKAIEKSNSVHGQNFLSGQERKLQILLRNFETANISYKDSLRSQIDANNKFQKLVKNARLYISHFIQVLNLAIIRNEIKLTCKSLYKLDSSNFAVPDLSNNEALLGCGEAVIKGEQARISGGGVPIYNPTIARVNVAYSQFKEAYYTQKSFQKNTNRLHEELISQRGNIDKALIDLWNTIELEFSNLPQEEKINQCRDFGVIYYLRKEEKTKQNQTKSENANN